MRKFFITALVSLAFTGHSFAAPKDADATYNFISKEYTFNADGSQSCRTTFELTYNSYHAIHNMYGETFIDYNPQWQDLVINSSYTKKADGTIVMTPENAFVETLPKYAENAPAHNGIVRMVVVHTGLEPGCTAYLDYSIVSRPGYLPELDIFSEVETGSPVAEMRISITVPQEKNLRYAFSKISSEPVETVSNGMKSYVWTLKNIEAASSDPGDYVKSYFTASTFSSEEDAFSFLSAQFINPGSIDSAIVASVNINGPDEEKISLVNRFLFDNLAIVQIPLEAACYRIRDLKDILASAYAIPAEREIVRCALLQAVGVKAEVVPQYRFKPFGLSSIERLRTDAVSEKGITSFEKKFRTKLEYDESNLENGYLVVSLPFERHSFNGQPYAAYPTSRSNELNLRRNINEIHEYEIILKDGLVPSGLENMQASISNDAGYCNVKAKREGDRITVTRTIEIYKSTIPTAEYNDFRELVATWVTARRFIVRKP